MSNIFNFAGFMQPMLYLVIALVLGMVLGLERTLAHKIAGVRTYGLVAMGACLFILLARYIAPVADVGSPGQMYVLQGLIMGIGFIGGGTILRTHEHHQEHASGLTTAAGLWITAGIGAAVGYRLVPLAIFVTLSTLIVFTIFLSIEKKLSPNN
ncbi:MgtC/SapB family protein [Candidatus Parcubacteria bacterium]|nr:MgtC/SapB family protein [Candidatus Parcubacteria bacterium]